MSKKLKSTTDEFFESLSPAEKKHFDKQFRDFALSEMVLAAMAKDEISVRKLAKLAGVSPTIVQAIRSGSRDDFTISSVFKVLHGLGYSLLLEKDGHIVPLDISQIVAD